MTYTLKLPTPFNPKPINIAQTEESKSKSQPAFVKEILEPNSALGDQSSSIRKQLQAKSIIEILMEQRKPYLEARNKIVDNPLKYLLPFYKKQLRFIDAALDKIDLEIYEYESSNMPTKDQLKSILLETKAEVAEYLQGKTK